MAPVAAIVPFRADDAGVRVRNLHAVLRWLCAMPIEVVLVEHAVQPDPRVRVPAGVRRIHLQGAGPFNRAAACNAGFAASSTAVVALVDADTLVAPWQFLGCARRVAGGVDVIRPFGRLIELDRDQSSTLQATGELPEAQPGPRDDTRGTDRMSVCCSIAILRSETYAAVGGMDETFAGWGGEDDALAAALLRSGADCRVLSAYPAFHLWHSRTPQERFGHACFMANVQRAAWWEKSSDAEFADAQRRGEEHLAGLADALRRSDGSLRLDTQQN